MNITNDQILVSKFHFLPKEPVPLKKKNESWLDGSKWLNPGSKRNLEPVKCENRMKLWATQVGSKRLRRQLEKALTDQR